MFIKIALISICVLGLLAIYDLVQKKHTIWRNFPVIGHLRFIIETAGPELRQYIVAGNREELPFTRVQRSWVYASSKGQNTMTGFGSDFDTDKEGAIFFAPAFLQKKHKKITPKPLKVIGIKREKPYHPQSIVNISGMSYGSLSPEAVTSLNQGAALAGCFHNTGEGGFSKYHDFGADVCFQIGTAYYSCRDHNGNFSLEKLVTLVKNNPCIRLIEIKLSQGAKAGKGGILPKEKVNKEIAETRGIPIGEASISLPYHTAFINEDIPDHSPTQNARRRMRNMVEWIEQIATATGLPVGIKSAVGELESWYELAGVMKETGKGPDFITIDGGEGGTGAAPATFADHVALPFFEGFALVYKIFSDRDLNDQVVWIGSGKLGVPSRAVKALAMGVDMINIARTALLSMGCIQAQKCHTDKCPTGIATQNKWLRRGMTPSLKKVRFAKYHENLIKTIMEVTHACGYEHPALIPMDKVEMRKLGKITPITQYYEYTTNIPEKINLYNNQQELVA